MKKLVILILVVGLAIVPMLAQAEKLMQVVKVEPTGIVTLLDDGGDLWVFYDEENYYKVGDMVEVTMIEDRIIKVAMPGIPIDTNWAL